MSTLRTFSPRARIVKIASLRPGDGFMDMEGRRMVRIDTDGGVQAMTSDTYEAFTYLAGAEGFVCDPSPLKGPGISLLEAGDRVRILAIERLPGARPEAIGAIGTVTRTGVGRRERAVEVLLDVELTNNRKHIAATAVELLNRLPWD